MVEQKLIDAVKKLLKEGVSEATIKKQLLQKGGSEEEVESALELAKDIKPKIFCWGCGRENEAEAEFCNKCGVNLKEPIEKKLKTSPEYEGKKEVTLKGFKAGYFSKAVKVEGIIVSSGGVVLMILGIMLCITIVGIIPGIFIIMAGVGLIVGGDRMRKGLGTRKFKCPYCGKEIMAMSGDDVTRCSRCGERILLRWVVE